MYASKLDKRIQEERLLVLVQNLPSSLLSTLAVSIFMFYIVVDHVSTINAIVWLSLILFLTLLRTIHTHRLVKYKKGNYLSEEIIIVLGIFMSGVLLASSVFVIFPPDDLALQALCFFLLSAMMAGAVSVYSTHILSFVSYTLPLIISFLYKATTLPDMLSILFIVGLAYYAILLSSMFRVNRSIINFLKTKYLNYDLADHLSKAKESLEKTNAELKIENSVREDTQKRLYYLANYDPLTGLSNRHMFKENLKDSIKLSKEKESSIALLFLDLDNFKIINDTLGHAMGDKLLIAVSSRLKSLLNDKSSIARLGGDEFVIIMNEINDNEEVSSLAHNIIKLLEKPFSFNEHEMFIGTSIGISLYPSDTIETETLLSYADTAMYIAKDKGKNNYQFFTAQMYEDIQFRHNVETKLHHAIKNKEFRLSYQPKVDSQTNKVVGAEALLRWDNHELGHISPSIFIPIAEESSLINEIGKWVILKVCEDLAYLKSNFNNNPCISLNVSSSQILHQNLPQLIQEGLDKYSLSYQCLELEFTEKMLIKQAKQSLIVLNQLDKMGITLSIDDFGTGYSSLNYLRTLPIHTLKIDKSFIKDTPHSQSDCAIAKSIISLAHNLNLNVIAEGVETMEQLIFLRDNACHTIQGFYFSKPLDLNEFAVYLNTPKAKALEIF
ncbi:EAL domain-containing protein [Sulfurimonas sp. MAG313]|nr:EAL domain-containing protein [Sulfurimonas sp. MAG313]MDF1882222.1 EAL domain-containing protein [Sulfurimonas sp. MAG313]